MPVNVPYQAIASHPFQPKGIKLALIFRETLMRLAASLGSEVILKVLLTPELIFRF